MDITNFNVSQEDELLSRNEGHFFDFKRAQIAPGKLQQSIAAFANADGGELFVGIDDNVLFPASQRIFGFVNMEAANNHVAISETMLEPRLYGVTVEFIRLPTKPTELILHLIIPKSDKVHYTSDKECFKRHGAQNLRIRGKDIENLLFSKGQQSYEDTMALTVTAGELKDSDYLEKYLSLVPSAQPALKFLKKQRLIEPVRGKSLEDAKVRTAAVLLFDDEPQAALSTRAGVKITRYNTRGAKYDRSMLSDAPLSIEGPTDLLIRRSVAKVEEIMNTSYFRIKGRFKQLSYPPAAIHEIIANAVLHRDYSIKDDIHIAIYDNRIEVTSPGRLPGHITPKNILEERFMRNPKIVRLVNKLPDPPNKDIGEGLNTAFREMQRARLKVPIIDELESAVKVTMLHEPIASADHQVIEYLQNHPTIKNKVGRAITGRESMQAVYKVFARLIDAGVIQPVDPEASEFEREYKLTRGWRKAWDKKQARRT